MANRPSTSTVPAPRDDPRVDRTRSAVLDAARAIILEEGWDAVTHLRVADESGVTRGTLYRHWPDRMALIQDALKDIAVRTYIQAAPTGDLRVDLITDLDAIRRELTDEKIGRVLAALVDRSRWDPALDRMKLSAIRSGVEPLRTLIVQAIEQGQLRPTLTPDYAVSLLVGPLVFREMLSGEVINEAFVISLVDDFLDGHQV